MNKKSTNINLIVIRHGKAAHNLGGEKAHTFAGSKVDTELSDIGSVEAEELAKNIFEKFHKVDLIISSGLKRSQQTAQIIKKELDKKNKTNIVCNIIEDANEFDVGDFAGKNEEEVKKLFPKAASAFYDGRIKDWDFPNGENYIDLKKRVDNVYNKIKTVAKNGDNVLLVGHGGFNRVLFYTLIPDQEEYWKVRNYPHDRIVEIELGKET